MDNNISFQEPQYQTQSFAPQKSKFIQLAYKTGIPKSDRDAEKLLLMVAGGAIVLAVAIFAVYQMSKPEVGRQGPADPASIGTPAKPYGS